MPNPLLTAKNRILPALVTPLLPDGQLDVKSAERLITRLYDQGVGGLYVTGSTGEGIYLDFDLRKQLVEIAVALSRGRGSVGACPRGVKVLPSTANIARESCPRLEM